MNFFVKLKNILFKNKTKRLPSESDTEKVIKLALKEKNPDRILEILNNTGYSLTSSEITSLIENLPISKRVSGMKVAKRYITPYDLFELINKKLDTNNKIIALEEFQNQLDLYDIYTIFDNLPPDKRTESLEKCIDRFDSVSLGEMIKLYIPLVERADNLYKYEELIDSYSKVDIIKKILPKETLTALEKYKNEISHNNIADIITNLPSNNTFEALSICYDKLTMNEIRDIIMYNIPEFQKLKALKCCAKKLNISIITDIIKYSISENEKEYAILDLADLLDISHIEEIVQDLKVSSVFLEVLSTKFVKDDIKSLKSFVG